MGKDYESGPISWFLEATGDSASTQLDRVLTAP
jgi:hypothetical protein